LDGLVDQLPNRSVEFDKRPKELDLATGIFVSDGKFLVVRRPIGGLWSGLWEFPTIECNGKSRPNSRFSSLAKQQNLIPVSNAKKTAVVKHQLTHRALTFHVYVVPVESRSAADRKIGKRRWVDFRGFRGLAVSTAHRKVFSRCQERIRAYSSE